MAEKPETRFKNRIRPLLNQLPKSWWMKTQMLALLGIPDLVGCVNGRFVGLELKVDSPVTELQLYVLKKISDAGGFAKIVSPGNFEQVLAQLKALANQGQFL